MTAPQIVLAALCATLGLAPQIGFRMAHAALAGSQYGLATILATVPPLETAAWTGTTGPSGLAVLSPLVLAAVVAVLLLVAAGISVGGGAVRRSAEPWLCGYVAETDQMRYGARNLYREVARYFPWVRRTPPAGGNGARTRAESHPPHIEVS
jgi:hypothetical protein